MTISTLGKIRLIHWNAAEAEERASRLREAGYAVDCEPPQGPTPFLRSLRAHPPLALVISLERVPSHGRDVALSVRAQAATRRIPLVFVGGSPDKVAAIRALLPDATYTSWDAVAPALAQAIAHPPDDPVVHRSVFAPYAGRPLAAKLGIKEDMTVCLVDAPPDFAETLADLPQGVTLRRGIGDLGDLAIWFVRSPEDLAGGMAKMAEQVGGIPLWIAWPKKGSPLATDLGQQDVRDAGLAAGLVDYKICAIDSTWSGLLFRRRKR